MSLRNQTFFTYYSGARNQHSGFYCDVLCHNIAVFASSMMQVTLHHAALIASCVLHHIMQVKLHHAGNMSSCGKYRIMRVILHHALCKLG